MTDPYLIPESKPMVEAVFEAIGAASMCWATPEGAGVFDSDRAKVIADALLVHIRGSNSTERPLRLEPFEGTHTQGRGMPKPAWFFRLRAANGEIVAQSESYTSPEARDETMGLIAGRPIIVIEED